MALRDMDAVSRDERRMVLFHAVRPQREEGTNLSTCGSRILVLPLLPGIFGVRRGRRHARRAYDVGVAGGAEAHDQQAHRDREEQR